MSDIDSNSILEILAFCVKTVATAGIKDQYENFKELIKSKIANTTVAETVEPEKLLEQYQKNPHVWNQLMKAALDEAQVVKDKEIIDGALHLLASRKSTQDIGTVQGFNNNGSGTQVNVGNQAINNHNVYNQASEFFDEIDERNGFRTRTTYRRDPATGVRVIVAQGLP